MLLEPGRSIIRNETGYQSKRYPSAQRKRSGRNMFFHAGIAIAFSLLVLTLVVVDGQLRGGSQAVAGEPLAESPVVMELFTSQGCYSCPPADALFGELIAENPNLIALEFHVDYWDDLVYGSHGQWKDPFSSRDNSLRQHAYNQQRIEGRRGVYTPQLVVNGRYAAVGSQRRYVNHGIKSVQRPAIDVTVEHDVAADSDTTRGLQIKLAGGSEYVPQDAHIWLAVFDIEKTTEIPAGENHDKTLTNHHVVRQFEQVTPRGGYAALTASGTDNLIEIDTKVQLSDGQGCAVLVQRRSPGPIYGASYCPASLWKKSG